MTLSKEARILLAIFAVLGLGFAWLHFSTRLSEPAPAAVNTPVPNRERADNTPLTEQPSQPLEAQSDGQVTGQLEQPEGLAGQPEGQATEPMEAQADEPFEPRVARDLQVAQLPFLVTSPPAADAMADAADAEGEFGTEEMPTTESGGSQRASVNPFSPLVIAEAEPDPNTNPNAGQQITDVPVPSQPPQVAAAPTARRAPIPAARAPSTPGTLSASRLPRSLPNSTLASTPDILRNALSTPVNVQQAQNPLVNSDASASSPLAAGSSPLSLYLRDREVTFTGAVLGPVSVGIFRSADNSAPFIVPLGQSIPNTDIVLTDLTGQQAELTQGDNAQFLILDLRR